jgi:DNA modification methylase
MSRIEVIGNATLYLGDCRDILPTLPKVDAVITDPPYGVHLGEHGPTSMGKVAYSGFVDSPEYVRSVCVAVIKKCLQMASRVVITPGNRNCFSYPPPDEIGAIYNPAGAGFCRWGTNTSQPILYYGKDPHKNRKLPQSVQWNELADKNGHPCPKPTRLMIWIVNRASLDGELVVDPFMGSGTTGVACMNLGRSFIGIEREPKYFDIACRRIQDAQRQGRLIA